MSTDHYPDSFYAEQREGSLASARVVVPMLCALFSPTSVVDVGCGVGGWLSEFRRAGVEEIAGLDGAWVEPSQLAIDATAFTAVDLSSPIHLDRTFALCMSLEVAEHLAEEHAEQFVDSLASLAPIVVFSAAIPGQTGVCHVNEQWPDYWASRFQKRGYAVLDCVRPQIWEESAVQWWYAQNMLVFVRNDLVDSRPDLAALAAQTRPNMLNLVHPRMLAKVAASRPAAAITRRRWRDHTPRLVRGAYGRLLRRGPSAGRR